MLVRQGYDEMAVRQGLPDHMNKGEGCARCNYTGFKGRSGIYELLEINDKIRGLIVSKAIASEIQRAGLVQGMRTMLFDGVLKVREGKTTIEEVLRVTSE